MKRALVLLAFAACTRAPAAAPEQAVPEGTTITTCYAGTLTHTESFSGVMPTEPETRLRYTYSPSFSSITEELKMGDAPPRIFDILLDGEKGLVARERGDDEHEAIGQINGDPARPDEWSWTFEERGNRWGYYHSRRATGLYVEGGTWTFEPVTSDYGELSEVPCYDSPP
jgi:hypothetical protein